MSGRRAIWLLAAATLLTAALGGCTTPPLPSDVTPVSAPPLVEKLPLAVGIHYPPGTRDYFFERSAVALGLGGGKFELGPPSMRHFNMIFRAMFERAEEMDADPKSGDWPARLDGVLVTSITDFSTGCGYPALGTCGTEIDYSFVLLRRDKSEIASWNIRGSSRLDTTGRSGLQSAMRDATATFMIEFYRDQRVKEWLAGSRAIRDSGGRS